MPFKRAEKLQSRKMYEGWSDGGGDGDDERLIWGLSGFDFGQTDGYHTQRSVTWDGSLIIFTCQDLSSLTQ